MSLSADELSRAVAILSSYLQKTGVEFSISGGAAGSLRQKYNLGVRHTNDIDLVVQPDGKQNAETISKWLCQTYPEVFVEKWIYGAIIPALIFTKNDHSKVHVEIEIFDIGAWPHRTQYDLRNPDNERITMSLEGVSVPIFGARWMLREKIVTAYERQGSMKEQTDLDDATALLRIVPDGGLDLTQHSQALQHILTERPRLRKLLQQKVYCPVVFGDH